MQPQPFYHYSGPPSAAMWSPIPIEPTNCMVVFISGKWLAGAYRQWSRTRWRPYLSTYALLTCLQFDTGDPFYGPLAAVKSRCLTTSITWPYHGVRLKFIEVKCFFEVDRWPGYGFRGLKYFYRLVEQTKNKKQKTKQKNGAPLLDLAKSIYLHYSHQIP